MAPGSSPPELVVIVGETASGKSALAAQVAKNLNGEVINADSWQVYKGFDIGTSKPSAAEQKAVKHHLINVADAKDGFNAALYKKLAQAAITDIKERDKLSVLVGGTGLYVDSLLYDFGFLPGSSDSERQKLNALSIDKLLSLAGRKRINLSGVDTRNKRRIIRAIESGGQKPTKKTLQYDVCVVGLKLSRSELKERVVTRTERMIKSGLEAEVKRLADLYGWQAEPMKGIGYREWQAYFAGEQSLEQTKQRIVSSTMNLAKRQRTWFKRNPDINWFDSPQKAFEAIKTVVN